MKYKLYFSSHLRHYIIEWGLDQELSVGGRSPTYVGLSHY